MPKHLDEGRKGDRRRERQPGAGKGGGQSAGEACQVKSLEEGLEQIPFADETGLRRHRGQAHRREQRADAEDPRAARKDPALNQHIVSGRAIDAIGREEHRALRQSVPREMKERHGPGETGQVHQAVLSEHQGGAQQANRDRSVLRRRQAQQLSPPFLLEGVERGEDGAQHRDRDDDDAGDGDRQRRIGRQPFDEAAARARRRRRSTRRPTAQPRSRRCRRHRRPGTTRRTAAARASRRSRSARADRRRAALVAGIARAAAAKSEKDRLSAGIARRMKARISATEPASRSASMKSTGRPFSGASSSPRIITAPPRLMISQATRKLTASCKPKTPSAPMRLAAAPKIHLGWRRVRRAEPRRENCAGQPEAQEPECVGRKREGRRRPSRAAWKRAASRPAMR